MKFSKYHGIGNDFIVTEDETVTSERARALCERHRGIGADGVLITGIRGGAPFMRVINADGSIAEMCGNGIRCVARYLLERRLMVETEFSIETDGGPHRVRIEGTDVRVWMAIPIFAPTDVPIASDQIVIDQPMRFGNTELRVTALSMGNPHLVTFDGVGSDRALLGPLIERDPRFPRRINVGFARIGPDGGIDLSVWERGVGFTQACGTGACAAAVAAVETNRAERNQEIAVRLPGGALSIVVRGRAAPVEMTGPTAHVFDGQV